MIMKRAWKSAIVLGVFCLASLIADSALAQQAEWAGTSMIEHIDPKAERGGTLRVIRFSSDLSETLTDQETIVGWGNAASTGTVKPRDEPGETESIEILRRGQASAIAPKD
jgi:hypothetical protein